MRITIDVTDWRDFPAKTKADLDFRAYIVAQLEYQIIAAANSFAETHDIVVKVYKDPDYA